ncbi:hypothetical protein [Rhizobium sp. Root1220]|uniref:hypothetical protein n=1 Tax=Rhizobium sp. Root1220 TaxID=1736432 RepID=UPI0009EC5367|nr:hypothetical protein [Rhizobium sp. Root1220]
MSTIRAFVAAVALIGMTALTSACTPVHNSNRADYQYQPRTSVNPACADGFRPSNDRQCSY